MLLEAFSWLGFLVVALFATLCLGESPHPIEVGVASGRICRQWLQFELPLAAVSAPERYITVGTAWLHQLDGIRGIASRINHLCMWHNVIVQLPDCFTWRSLSRNSRVQPSGR